MTQFFQQIMRQPPAEDKGFQLYPYPGTWKLVVPEATTNLFPNPSWEGAFPGLTYVNATGAKSSLFATHGTNSLEVTPSSSALCSARYDLAGANFTASTVYTWSLDILSPEGAVFFLEVFDSAAGAQLGYLKIKAAGFWQRYSLHFVTLSSVGANVQFKITKAALSTQKFYSDSWQVEQKAYETTYIDGDMSTGLWQTVAHASVSTRAANVEGGRIYDFLTDLNLQVMSVQGMGNPAFTNILQDNGYLGGSSYQRTALKEKLISLICFLQSDSTFGMLLDQSKFTELAYIDEATQKQPPYMLRFQPKDVLGNPAGLELEVPVYYYSGLEGPIDSMFNDKVTISFMELSPPSIRETVDQGKAMASIGGGFPVNSYWINQRLATGVWDIMAKGYTNSVGNQTTALFYTSKGYLYVGGGFTKLGDSVVTQNVGYWDGAAWHGLGTGTGLAGDYIYAIQEWKDGKVYILGDFTTFDGAARAKIVAWEEGIGGTALGTGLTGGFPAGMCIGPDGNLWVSGAFTAAGGVASNGISIWDGAAWTAAPGWVGPGAGRMIRGKNGNVYVVYTTSLMRYDGTAWTTLGTVTGPGSPGISAMAAGVDGSIYIAGYFTAVNGVSAKNIARWNGGNWESVGPGLTLSGIVPMVQYLYSDPLDGALWIIGQGIVSSGDGAVTFPGNGSGDKMYYIRWDGAAFHWLDVLATTAAGGIVQSPIIRGPQGNLVIGTGANSASIKCGQVTQVTNTGTAAPKLKIIITGPGELHDIINFTTNKYLWFRPLTLLSGETCTLDLDPMNISFWSTYRGNIIGELADSSDVTTWKLARGINNISVLMRNTTGASSVTLFYRNTYLALESGT